MATNNVKELKYLSTEVLVEFAKKALQAKADANGNIITSTYATKQEIADVIHLKVVSTLPAVGEANTMYFVPKTPSKAAPDKYSIHIWVSEDNAYQDIGGVGGDLDLKVDKLSSTGLHVYTHTGTTQGELGVDTTVTSSSSNLITSGAVATGLSGKISTSDIVDNTSSTSTTKVPSARVANALQDEINNLKAIGRYLSGWNCATGLPTTNPETSPYTYQTGDYYVVSTVATGSGTNYKPNGSSYTTGVASTTVETQTVKQNDYYRYDGLTWQLEINTQRTVTFGSISGSPSDNTALQTAFDTKQDELTEGTGIDITSNTISIDEDVVALKEDLPEGEVNLTLTSTSISDGTTTLSLKVTAEDKTIDW